MLLNLFIDLLLIVIEWKKFGTNEYRMILVEEKNILITTSDTGIVGTKFKNFLRFSPKAFSIGKNQSGMYCFSFKCTTHRLYLHLNFTIAHSGLHSNLWTEQNQLTRNKICIQKCVILFNAWMCAITSLSLVFSSSFLFLCIFVGFFLHYHGDMFTYLLFTQPKIRLTVSNAIKIIVLILLGDGIKKIENKTHCRFTSKKQMNKITNITKMS